MKRKKGYKNEITHRIKPGASEIQSNHEPLD